MQFAAGTEHRVFVAVPEGATWGELVLKAGAHDTPKVSENPSCGREEVQERMSPGTQGKKHSTRLRSSHALCVFKHAGVSGEGLSGRTPGQLQGARDEDNGGCLVMTCVRG